MVWRRCPKYEVAIQKECKADIFIIIVTSLNVFPAALLINYAIKVERIILIDPNASYYDRIEVFSGKAKRVVSRISRRVISIIGLISGGQRDAIFSLNACCNRVN